MTSCILTVIKNEQEYLDEWISYHLNLGIEHIFIFEDIDSESHKEICDKYEKVTLNSIDIVLDQNNKNMALINKSTKHRSAHIIYLKNGLSYLKNNYKYNWCFIIDIDEFITFENLNDNIQNILNLYKEYDAFTIEWKCYGANGHISKPNYSNKGIIETYIEETKGNLIEEPYKSKVCFNLNKYHIKYFFNPHIPNKNICKFYNVKNIIYIRHYITKSLEEYIWKKYIRGYIWGCRRNLDFFFSVNPELISYKNRFMECMNEKILVVLPYKQSMAQGREIELTLSLFKKFCTFNYHFVVIGEFDDSLKNKFPWVEFIDYKIFNKCENQYEPHIDIINKFDFIIQKYSQIYNGFIYITDDEYAIKSFTIFDILQTYYHSKEFVGNEKSPTSYWSHDKWKTRQLLDRENLPHINYTTHYPCFFEFNKLKEICDKFNLKNESYVFDDIYFNYFKHEEPILDSEIRLGIWNKEIFNNEFQNALDNPNIKFCCNSIAGWSIKLEQELEKIINT